MTRLTVVVALFLAGCTDPSVDARVRLTPDGVRVVPSVSGSLGGVDVTVSR